MDRGGDGCGKRAPFMSSRETTNLPEETRCGTGARALKSLVLATDVHDLLRTARRERREFVLFPGEFQERRREPGSGGLAEGVRFESECWKGRRVLRFRDQEHNGDRPVQQCDLRTSERRGAARRCSSSDLGRFGTVGV